MGLWRKLTYPRKLDSLFTTHRCPDCGSKDLLSWQDGGHDVAFECSECHAKFGVQLPPFNMIERLSPAQQPSGGTAPTVLDNYRAKFISHE